MARAVFVPGYGYDGANRLAKIWTDISGHDVDHPLVSYTYDAFGNLRLTESMTQHVDQRLGAGQTA